MEGFDTTLSEESKQRDASPAVKEVPPRWRRVWTYFAGLAGGLAILAAIPGNTEKVVTALDRYGRPVAESGLGLTLSIDSARDVIARRLLGGLFPSGEACPVRSHEMDLTGSGRMADLAVVFVRYSRAGPCPREGEGSSQDIAFFRRSWLSLSLVSMPPLAEDIGVWNVAGSAAFQEVADSSFPAVRVFMLRDGRIEQIGNIDTVSFRDYRGTNYLRLEDGRAALVVNEAGLTRVGFDASGSPVIEPFTAAHVRALGRGLHLMTHSMTGEFSFNGSRSALLRIEPIKDDPGMTTEPSADEVFVARMPAGDRLYVVGCRPGNGVKPDPRTPGAFTVAFAESPHLDCYLGEDSRFLVRLEPMNAN